MIPTPYIPDLTPFAGGGGDAAIGLEPLAIGWLRRGKPFETGKVPAAFPQRLLAFCLPDNLVSLFGRPLPCGLENHPVEATHWDGRSVAPGLGEIRVIGDEEIFAAPDLIYHYVTAHRYRPPDAFIEAVLHGPPPDSAEFKALIRMLQRY